MNDQQKEPDKSLEHEFQNLKPNLNKNKSFKQSKFKMNLQMTIKDTGAGVSSLERSRMFIDFNKLGDVNYKAESGQLGLSVSK